MFKSVFRFFDRSVEWLANIQTKFLQFVIDLNNTGDFSSFMCVLRFLGFLVLLPVALLSSLPVLFLIGVRYFLGGVSYESKKDN